MLFAACSTNGQKRTEDSPALEDTTRIPFTKKRYKNLVTVDLSIYNKVYTVAIDNGTAPDHTLTIFDHVALRTGLADSTLPFYKEKVRIDDLRIPIRLNTFIDTIQHVKISTLKNLQLVKDSLPQGILGQWFFRKYNIEIDYHNNFIRLHPLSDKIPDGYKPINLEFENGPFHFVEVTYSINGQKITQKIGLDLGLSSEGLLLAPKVVANHPGLIKDINNYKTKKNYSMAGINESIPVELDDLNIQGWQLEKIQSSLIKPTQENQRQYLPTLFGNDILRRAGKVMLCLSDNKIYIPSSLFNNK